MSAALPYAIRARFRECIDEGLIGRAAAAWLKLSAATGVRWQRKLRMTGSVAPDVQGRLPGHDKLATHRAFLEELVAQDGDITLPELAGPWKRRPGLSPMPHPSGGSCASLGTRTKSLPRVFARV